MKKNCSLSLPGNALLTQLSPAWHEYDKGLKRAETFRLSSQASDQTCNQAHKQYLAREDLPCLTGGGHGVTESTHRGHVALEVALVGAALAAQHARVLAIAGHRVREFRAA